MIKIFLILFFSTFLNSNTHPQFDMVGPHPKKLEQILQLLSEGNTPKVNYLLMSGPPGTGKSRYAKELAEKADCNFIPLCGSDFIDRYVGTGASKIRDAFRAARGCGNEYDIDPYKITVLFIDEVDIFLNKNEDSGEYTQTSGAFWTELDAIKSDPSIFVIMATNNKKIIRKRVVDRIGANQFEIALPDTKKREALFRFYLEENNSIDFKKLAKYSKGLSNRAIENACLNVKEYAEVEKVYLTTKLVTEFASKVYKKDSTVSGRVLEYVDDNKKDILNLNQAEGLVVHLITIYNFIEKLVPQPRLR